MYVALGFVFIGGAFLYGLLKSIGKMLMTDWDQESFTASKVISIFAIPIALFVFLILFIVYGIPMLEGK